MASSYIANLSPQVKVVYKHIIIIKVACSEWNKITKLLNMTGSWRGGAVMYYRSGAAAPHRAEQ